MSESLGQAVLTLDADQGPLNAAMSLADQALGGRLSTMSTKMKSIGTTMSTPVVMGVAAVGAAAVAAGVALYKIGENFDEAYDIIQVKTGATGQRLEGLKNDFKNVVSSVPTDFKSAAEAVGGFAQRLDLTGEPLRAVSKQALELSRLTGEDLNEVIESSSRLFGDWGISADNMAPSMDKLFRLSQKTGIPISELSRSMVQFGSPLRQLGFDFETTAAMFAKFEKEGVNTQSLMPGFKFALKNLSEPTAELRGTFDDLGIAMGEPKDMLDEYMLAIKNAPSDMEANSLAFQLYGQRAGPDMAAAIREGRFEFGDLISEMENGEGTILGAAAETNDFSENWLVFKNKVLVGLEPLATAVFNAVNKGLIWLMEAATTLGQEGPSAINDLKAAVAPLILAFQAILPIVKSMLGNVIGTLQGAFDVIRGLVTFFSGLFTGDFQKMKEGIGLIFGGLKDMIVNALQAVTAPARAVAGKIGDGISAGFNAVRDLPGKIGTWLGNAKDKVTSAVGGFGNAAVQLGKAVVGGVVDFIKALPGKVWDFMVAASQKVADVRNKAFNAAVGVGGDIVSGMVEKLKNVPAAIWTAITNFVDSIVNKIEGLLGISSPSTVMANIGGHMVSGLIKGVDKPGEIMGVINKLFGSISKLGVRLLSEVPGKVFGVAGDLGGKAVDFISGIFGGGATFADMQNWAASKLRSFIDAVASFTRLVQQEGWAGAVKKMTGGKKKKGKNLDTGTQYWSGGPVLVGGRGPEIANLPRGTSVVPNHRLDSMLGSGGPPQVRVFIGDTELTDIVRTEIKERDAAETAIFNAGVRP